MGCYITVTTAVKWWIGSHHYCLATDTAAPAVQVANGWTWTTADRLTQTQPTIRHSAAGKPVYLVTGVYPYVYPYHCWFCYSIDGSSIAVQTSAILLRIMVVHFTESGSDSGSQSWCTLWRQTETAVAGFLAPLQVVVEKEKSGTRRSNDGFTIGRTWRWGKQRRFSEIETVSPVWVLLLPGRVSG